MLLLAQHDSFRELDHGPNLGIDALCYWERDPIHAAHSLTTFPFSSRIFPSQVALGPT